MPVAPAVAVAGPPMAVYRVSRHGRGPFDAPPWSAALPDGTFGNRFDDPAAKFKSSDRFRVIYCASERSGAFGESIARFRPSLALLAQLRDGRRSLESVAKDLGLPIADGSIRGVVPRDWWFRRQIGQARFDSSLRFVDLSSGETFQWLRDSLSHTADQLGIGDIDLNAVTGPQRRFTQECARLIFEQREANGRPLYAGLRYVSRLHAGWECWAVFDRRARFESVVVERVTPTDHGLVEAAGVLGLEIES